MNSKYSADNDADKEFYLGVVDAIRSTPDGTRKFFQTKNVHWIQKIEENWGVVYQEYLKISKMLELLPPIDEISQTQKHLNEDKKWKIFPFFGYGVTFDKNLERCPETTKLLQIVPGIRGAMFSIMSPGKYIEPHVGAYCGVIRYHLGVKIPDPIEQCGISVGGEIRHWEQGKSILFDDTHTHSAWNNTSDERVVLLIDLERPLEGWLDKINKSMINKMAKILIDGTDKSWELWESENGKIFDELFDNNNLN
ncbi:MAG: aspartyl/asparaginyl beta-hydroxylase domain-containing protein [Exilibacterium sp.]